jgi:hypothetical protein
MTYELTPRADRIRVLRARRDQLDALIRRLEEGERQDGEGPRGDRQPPCGSDRGYDYHRKHGEEACEPCKEAHRTMQRLRYARKKATV